MSTPVGVALLGLGTVGSSVARAFADRGKRLDAAAGRPLRLVGAAVRDRRRARDVGDLAVTTDPFRLLDDPGLRRRMGEAGRQRVAERFTADAMVDRIVALYDEVAR